MNSMIMAMGLCYGGLAQIIAGIFEFQKNNLFGMIAFMSYGFFWWSLIITLILPKMGYGTAPDHTAMGCYLFIWGVFSLCMMVGTILKKAPWVLTWIFFTVVVLFELLAARHWADSETMEQVAGVEGVICGLSAIYLAFAELLNEFGGRTILPVGERKK
jgi:succinate-acetate transporter protein